MKIKTIEIVTDKQTVSICSSNNLNSKLPLPLNYLDKDDLQNQINLMTEVAKENNNEYLTIFHDQQSGRYGIIASKTFLQLSKDE